MTLKKNRRFFTLIEIMIVLAIISMVAGVVGFNIVKMRRDQQFRSGVSLVQQKLQAALETMLIHNENVKIVFEQEGSVLKTTMESETPTNRGLGRILNANPNIEGIKSAAWVTAEEERYIGKITLVFSAIAHAIPKGTIILSGYDSINTQGPLRKTIVLNGYPHSIKVTDDEMFEDKEIEREKFYPRQVREMREADAQKN
ncbi:MAG: hypothetical protein K940chlam3_00512 [Chlamydiae bacterium]|nr:hypothetical protein [Chlamydiota bacterium]